MKRTRRTRHRGFMFIELVFTLGMIAVVALITTYLYVDMTRSDARMLRQREAQQRFDLALRPLRSDTWNAATASVDASGALHLTRADGKTIQWQAGDHLQRVVEGEPAREWNQLGAKLSFAVEHGTVLVREQSAQSIDDRGEIALPLINAGLKGQTP